MRLARGQRDELARAEPAHAPGHLDLDIARLGASLARMRGQRIEFVELKVPSPFALPLMVERFREKLSTEKLKDRLERMLREMERVVDATEQPDVSPGRSPRRRRAP